MTNAVVLIAVALLGLLPVAVVAHTAVARSITVLEHANAQFRQRWSHGLAVSSSRRRSTGSTTRRAVKHTNANFATMFSFWHRALGIIPRPPTDVEIGLVEFRVPKDQTLPWVLEVPGLSLQRSTGDVTQSCAGTEVAK